MAKELWDMNLFESRDYEDSSGQKWKVLRVPGGWVLRERDVPSPAYAFVPLDNEFNR